MANLSWQFYKGYYEEFKDWNNLQSKEEEIKKRIALFFRKKNKPFLEYKLQSVTSDPEQLQFEIAYPGLILGSGYTHETGAEGEFKLGMQLDYTTGLPIIPGSSVKGKLRSEFPQFTCEEIKNWEIKNISSESEKAKEKAAHIGQCLGINKTGDELFRIIHELEQHIFEGLNIEASKKAGKCVYYSIYQRDIFREAIPIRGGADRKLFADDSITPHGGGNPLKNPIPLLFLKIRPKVVFEFRFELNAPPYEMVDTVKRKQLYNALLEETGIGAKTKVGYGQFISTKKKVLNISLDAAQTVTGESSINREEFSKKTVQELKDGEIIRAKVIESGSELRMQLPDISDAPQSLAITRNRSINYTAGEIYLVKVNKLKGKINKIEHTTNITPLNK